VQYIHTYEILGRSWVRQLVVLLLAIMAFASAFYMLGADAQGLKQLCPLECGLNDQNVRNNNVGPDLSAMSIPEAAR
jgi:hypothetical protein